MISSAHSKYMSLASLTIATYGGLTFEFDDDDDDDSGKKPAWLPVRFLFFRHCSFT